MNDTNALNPFVEAKDIYKKFKLPSHSLEILKGVTFSVERSSWTALFGASGSGKTTLLDIIGTISKPDSGSVTIGSKKISELSNGALVEFRRRKIFGFVFQAYHILPELNILENVMFPAMLEGVANSECREKAKNLLERVGLSNRMKHRPNELSGGEQQRAAIARALINTPKLLLADEPTGNLDTVTGGGILELFQKIREESDTTIIMVTHDRKIAALADKSIELENGVATGFREDTVS